MKYKINNKKEEEEERKSNLKNKLTEITGINFNTQVGRKAIEKWVQGHSEELIFLAAKVAAQYAQKPNIQYIETTLSNWKHQGFKTTEEAKNGIFDPKAEKRHSPKATYGRVSMRYTFRPILIRKKE